MIGVKFISGFIVGALLTSIYYNPQQTKDVVNRVIDLISHQEKTVQNNQDKLQETYQKAKDLKNGW